MKIKIKINKYIIIYFLLAFLPKFILVQFMQPLGVPLDESATLALPAYLVGYDWSYLMGKTRYYYGYGMSVLFTPLFLMIKNPTMLYRAVLTACALLQSIPGFIAFYLLETFFRQTDNRIKLSLALVASYCVSTTAMNAYNEHMLYIAAWITVWMILALMNCKSYRQKVIYTFFLVFTLFYVLTCHNRSKVFLMAVLGIIILFGIFQKKWLISPIAFLITSSLAYKVTSILTTKVQSIIWPVNEGKTTLANTATSVDWKLMKNKEAWYILYNLIFGQLGTGAVFTGGILIVAMILGCYLFIKKIAEAKMKKYDVNNNYFYPIIFGLMAIGATILAQTINGVPNAQNAIADSVSSEGGRIFTYIRYYFPCVGPVVVLLLNWLLSNNKRKEVKGVMTAAFPFILVLQINFMLAVIPLIERTPLINYIHMVYWNFSFMADGEWTSKYTFIPACLICIVFFIVFFMLINRGKKMAAICLLVGLLGYQYVMTAINTGILRSNQNYQAVQETWMVLKKMEADNILPEYLGVTEKRVQSTNQPIRFIYQYLLQDHRISYQEKVIGIDEAIYLDCCITPPHMIEEDTDTWWGIEITENQYIFFKGEELEAYFRKEGFEYFIIKK